MTKLIYPELSYTVQGALYDVYNELCYLELSEEGWESALLIALTERDVLAQQQVEYELHYKGYRIGRFFVDVLLAPIATRKITLKLKGRFRQYLRLLNLHLGLVANFHTPSLKIETVRI